MKSTVFKKYAKLRMIYEDNLNVDLIAEDLNTCDMDDDAEKVKQTMEQKGFDFFGVLEGGKVVGYVHKDALHKKKIALCYKRFVTEDLISDSTSLTKLLEIFQNGDYRFLLEGNEVSKIVTIADLHKQPFHMLIFSFISIFEMYLTAIIHESYPNDSWTDKISENRLEKAKEILQHRIEKNEALTLLDSTQLGDKGTIIGKTPKLLQTLGMTSRSKSKQFFSDLETLRNNTTHAQAIVYHNNKELLKILLQLKKMLERGIG